MSKRKGYTKRLCALALALLMVISLIPAMPTQAAKTKTKKVTMYVGEAFYYTNYSKVKKISCSKKSVVSAKKDSKNPSHTDLVAKKAGSAKVTIKTQYGTMKLNVTVKKFSMSVSMKDCGKGTILVSVKNNTKQIFDSATVAYSIADVNGTEVLRDTVRVRSLLPGKVSYTTISYNQYSVTPCIEHSIAKVGLPNRNPNYSYSNISSKVKLTETNFKEDTSSLSFTLTMKNNSSKTANGQIFILLYDEFDNVIGMAVPRSVYLTGKSVNSTTVNIYFNLVNGYDHYKILTRTYSSVYK